LFGRVENVFDENYEDVFSYATPGIGAHAGVKVRF
jgi:vitamin B12 transporter